MVPFEIEAEVAAEVEFRDHASAAASPASQRIAPED